MNGKRIIIDCSKPLGKQTTFVEPDAEFLAQREIDRVAFAVEEAEQAEKDEREALIQAEMRQMAIERLDERGEL